MPLPSAHSQIRNGVLAILRAVHEERPWLARTCSQAELVSLINRRREADGRAYRRMSSSSLSRILSGKPSFGQVMEILQAMEVYDLGIDAKHLEECTEEELYNLTKEELRRSADDGWLLRNSPGLLDLSFSDRLALFRESTREPIIALEEAQIPQHFGFSGGSVVIALQLKGEYRYVALFRRVNGRFFGLNRKLGFSNHSTKNGGSARPIPLQEVAGGADDFEIVALASRQPFGAAFSADESSHGAISQAKLYRMMQAVPDISSDLARIVVVH